MAGRRLESDPTSAASAPLPLTSLTDTAIVFFRSRLMHWYTSYARALPWRGIADPYRTWVSEVMLQQTRVAAVLEHYERFLKLFPTLLALALAPEEQVLAAWSGLGYYRRARMLHKAAQFVAAELDGVIPGNAAALRTLPGIGEYTCAAIASIAFGESVAVVDGNVERVLLRVTGRAQDPSAAGRAFIRAQAAALVPAKALPNPAITEQASKAKSPKAQSAKQQTSKDPSNAAGDHNQAMMELGATLCLPRAPLCLQCPVFDLCRTRGEHIKQARDTQQSLSAAYLLTTRKRGLATEVLLERRNDQVSLMPGMLELPPLPMSAVAGREPLMRLRHSITNTNYYVEIHGQATAPGRRGLAGTDLRRSVVAGKDALCWKPVMRLHELALTGLARKVLHRADLRTVAGPQTPKPPTR